MRLKQEFRVGDKVQKVRSYKFDGTIIGVCKKLDGKSLLNVEHKDGWVHIFRPEDLEIRI